ncbi:DUF389 domain-containing protein [Microbispora triticiradicis]|uniref:DUF389 domain-containing protein n=3 Tax=Microbispora TaxID=2005 RepID=A0ABY3LVI9_9ACTN|nr:MULTISPECIES: DUF389 domain-containing protein [Microbispora]RGA04768.1 DUF389 domain-containing protein [Microbispora triticiradicis]TLP62306.1 DUF389 domain-containing protein [Microbispora fusca]TYB56889.1 DUF389 domain-containing protein [Microbispora tritici]GLW22076.1 hypothetical protein Mame01_21190 [Microbispora amethystogenes]
MLHLRVIAPYERTDRVVEALDRAPGVTNVVVLAKAARRPEGDVVLADVAREAANAVIEDLKALGLEEDGSITAEEIELSISRGAVEAEERAPGEGDDAVVWDQFEARVALDSRITWAFLAFLTIATQLAAIGVLIPSQILIVGAMVLGPEFGAVAAVSFGLLGRHWALIGAAVRTLAVGFAVATAVTLACALVSRGIGMITPDMLRHNDEVHFIVKPDRWSFIVALLAGAAGVLSITAGKSSALVGVFISVTTVPAAGYMAAALALGRWDDVGGSALQLVVNIAGMVVAGTLTLFLQRRLWTRYGGSRA